jgi:hypothetical protein
MAADQSSTKDQTSRSALMGFAADVSVGREMLLLGVIVGAERNGNPRVWNVLRCSLHYFIASLLAIRTLTGFDTSAQLTAARSAHVLSRSSDGLM